jgi:uncharacterized repeat protein (TIGR01451 family)
MALGQIVPFEVEVTVSGSAQREDGKIQIVGRWSTKTESGFDFGYDPSFGVYCAFVDTSDAGNVSLAASTKVDSFSATTIAARQANEQIEGTINISGLTSGETAVVEIWVVLKKTLPPNAKGNVHSALQSATTCVTQDPCAGGAKINTGNQTLPLLRVQGFASKQVTADVSVVKTDDPDPVSAGGKLTSGISVTNNSTTTIANGVVVTDTLDPNTTFVSASFVNGTSQSCTATGGVVTCDVGALNQGQGVRITITVNVNKDAPTDETPGTSPIGGTCTQGQGFDLCNVVAETAVTSDPNTANNSDSEPTNVSEVPGGTIVIKKATDPAGIDNDFSFGSDLPCGQSGAFTLSGASGKDTFTCALTPAQLGTHTVVETDPRPAFELTDISCDDSDSSGDVASLQATLTVPGHQRFAAEVGASQWGHAFASGLLGQRRASDDSLRRAESETAGDYNAAADLSCLGAAHGNGAGWARRTGPMVTACGRSHTWRWRSRPLSSATSPCSASAFRSCSRVC